MEYFLVVLIVLIVALIWTLLDEDKYIYDPIKKVENDQNLVVLYKKSKKK